jgi:hypothetical protein
MPLYDRYRSYHPHIHEKEKLLRQKGYEEKPISQRLRSVNRFRLGLGLIARQVTIDYANE